MLSVSNRDSFFGKLGNVALDTFDDVVSQFQGLWRLQHEEDGGHGVITERNRDVALGVGTDVPYDPANFAGVTPGDTWDVPLAAHFEFSYALTGLMIDVDLVIDSTSTISGTPSFLAVKIPGTKIAARLTRGLFEWHDDGPTTAVGRWQVDEGSNLILLSRIPTAGWTDGSTFGVSLSARFEIQ